MPPDRNDLDALAAPGPFFALRGGPAPPDAVPLASLYAGGLDPLRARLETVAARLGTGESRVAASLAHQGLASRLWSVGLASAVLLDGVLALDPAALWWSPDGVTPEDLSLRGPHPPRLLPARDIAGTAEQIWTEVHQAHLVPLAAATRELALVAPGLLRGNAASALAGAARQLLRWARADASPEVAASAGRLAEALLHRPGV
ncbi:ferric iron reductase, partial [Streptomyces sp. SM14]|uniref:ferric iron reductase n=1 Tax=Streptomyces sp. SM14 TaxID=1736045 RepID=UPI000CD4E748